LTTLFEYYTHLICIITPITNAFEIFLQSPLQIETDGINDEKVFFYRRSVLHGIGPECQSTYDSTDEMGSREEFTCARTEVFPLSWHYQEWSAGGLDD
jgi:hypothetical protein